MTQYSKRLDIPSFNGISDNLVRQHSRAICLISLQFIKTLCENVWAISVAMDGATYDGKSYFDIRLRCYADGKIQNFHLMAIPMSNPHTGTEMLRLFTLLMNCVCPDWRDKIVGVSTDGAANMTGWCSDVVSLLQDEVRYPLTRIWCGAHQLDLIVRSAYTSMGDFVKILNGLTTFLRQPRGFTREVIRSRCPQLSETRWLSMSTTTEWIYRYRSDIKRHLDMINHSCKPPMSWWVLLSVVKEYSSYLAQTVRLLQGKDTTLEQQDTYFSNLVGSLCEVVGATTNNSDNDGSDEESDEDEIIQSGDYKVKLSSASSFINQLDLFISEECLQSMTEDEIHDVTTITAKLFLVSIDKISNLSAVRCRFRNEGAVTPSVAPRNLVQMRPSEFQEKILSLFRDRLENYKDSGASLIYKINDEFKELLKLYKNNDEVRSSIDNCSGDSSFNESWNFSELVNGNQFENLKELCGGILTVFPGTATVESDFSIVGFEKNDRRSRLTDFSLEGILHSKQFESLDSLSHTVSAGQQWDNIMNT